MTDLPDFTPPVLPDFTPPTWEFVALDDVQEISDLLCEVMLNALPLVGSVGDKYVIDAELVERIRKVVPPWYDCCPKCTTCCDTGKETYYDRGELIYNDCLDCGEPEENAIDRRSPDVC